MTLGKTRQEVRMDRSSKAIFLGRHIRHLGRFAQIANIFARHGFWSIMEAVGIRSLLSPEQVKEAEGLSRTGETSHDEQLSDTGPRRMRLAFEELGPAFVKLGQMLASREDLVPASYTEELRKLHQEVSSLPFNQIRAIIHNELQSKGLDKIEQVVETPLAAGSIGQVHKAFLKDGTAIVIKVQRPRIAEQIRIDLSLMELIAGLLEKYLPETKSLRPKVVVEEFRRGMAGELDFIREAGSTTKIAENFEGNNHIKIPEVHWDLTTSKVLTLSFIEGYNITDRETLLSAGLDPKTLVERGLTAFLQMVFVDGFYHGDLHAGNILALSDNRVAILDFGLAIKLGRTTQENLAGLLVALVQEDYESLVSYFAELADPTPAFDQAAFEEEVGNALTPFVGLKLAKIRTGRLLWDIAKIAAQHGAPLPRQLILFFKTLASFEGVGQALSPDFDVVRTCQRFSEKLVKRMYSPENLQRQGLIIARDFAHLARHAPRQIRGLLKLVNEGDLQINVQSKELLFAATSLDKMVSRLAVSVILASLIVGSSILVLARVGEQYFHMSLLGLIGFSIAGILSLYVIWSMLRGSR